MLKKIYLVSFIFSFSTALTTYVNSSLLEKFFSESRVGLIYVVGSCIALFMLLWMPKIIKFFGVYKFGLINLTLNVLASLGLILTTGPIVALWFFVFFATIPVMYFSFDLLVEHFSKSNKTGHNRGAYLLAVNLGWLFAPSIIGLIIKGTNFKPVYHLAQLVTVLVAILFIIFLRKFHDVKYSKQNFIETIVKLKKQSRVRSAIGFNFILQIFYAFMVIYSPIYLTSFFGLNWGQIGLIFSVMLSAFVLFQYPVGSLIDQGKINSVKTIYTGLLIMVLALTMLYTLPNYSSIILIAITLFLSRVGAAVFEAANEYFFFKVSDDSDSNFISIFRNMYPLAYIIAPILGWLVLSLQNKTSNVFILLAIFILLAGSVIFSKSRKYE